MLLHSSEGCDYLHEPLRVNDDCCSYLIFLIMMSIYLLTYWLIDFNASHFITNKVGYLSPAFKATITCFLSWLRFNNYFPFKLLILVIWCICILYWQIKLQLITILLQFERFVLRIMIFIVGIWDATWILIRISPAIKGQYRFLYLSP